MLFLWNIFIDKIYGGGVISFYSIFPKCSWFYFTGYDLNKMRGGGCYFYGTYL